jgi:hypothetical protein
MNMEVKERAKLMNSGGYAKNDGYSQQQNGMVYQQPGQQGYPPHPPPNGNGYHQGPPQY